MLCDSCGKEVATVHVTKVINNEKTEAHLCQECAREQGQMSFMTDPSSTFHNILAGLFDPETVMSGRPATRTRVRCENCGLSFGDFRRLGHLGCNHCYETFAQQLEPLIRRVQGNTRHTGKVPRVEGREHLVRERELEKLRKELAEAVAQEAYEKAAVIRDRIRELEAEQN